MEVRTPASEPMDGLQSFSSLAESLPQWTQKLETLTAQVSERHAEFAALSRASAGSISSLRRTKTDSNESLRPNDAGNDPPTPSAAMPTIADPTTTPAARVEINTDSRRLFHNYRIQAKRKRNSASIASAMSGTQRLRTRVSLIVYYDSAIQEKFEWLVRKIASARNNLRKGKTSASFQARLSGMNMEESPFDGNQTAVSMRNPNLARLPRPQGRFSISGYTPEAFDQADKELEAAQTFCEIGAHQFLRDGTCSDELSGTRERFDALLKIAVEQKFILEALGKEKAETEAEHRHAMRYRSGSGDLHIDHAPPTGSDITNITDVTTMNGKHEMNGHSGIAVDSKYTSNCSDDMAIEIDPLTIDTDHMADSGIAVDSDKDLSIDVRHHESPDGLLNDTIEIDENNDGASFHVDLAAFRSTRRR